MRFFSAQDAHTLSSGAGGCFPHFRHRTSFSETVERFALRRLGAGPAADVAVGHRLEALDHVAAVLQTAGEHVGEEGAGIAGKRHGCIHRAVSVVPIVGNGGDAPLPDIHPPPRSRPGHLLSAAHGASGDRGEGQSLRQTAVRWRQDARRRGSASRIGIRPLWYGVRACYQVRGPVCDRQIEMTVFRFAATLTTVTRYI